MSEFLTNTYSEMLATILEQLSTKVDASALIETFVAECSELSKDEVAAAIESLQAKGIEANQGPALAAFYTNIVEDKLRAGEINRHPPGHPARVYLEENRLTRSWLSELSQLDPSTDTARFKELFTDLQTIEKHYARKENQLFPYLEKHGWSNPSKHMWAFQDQNRAKLKSVREALDADDFARVSNEFLELESELQRMMSIEEQRLLPNAMQLLEDDDWKVMRVGDEEIGWMLAEAPPMFPALSEEELCAEAAEKSAVSAPTSNGSYHYDEGHMTPEQVNLIFRHIPVDLTYVDENDRVVFYNRGEDRVFPRSAAVIGREVKFCHPPKSVDTVLRIVEEFRNGTKDIADFWIQMKGKFIHIRYFAVRDADGTYRGVLEMSQDVTGIRELEGEQRLLDWV